ncbi:hypothetical protein ACHAPT_011740 [Fusarium lateritium]
MSEDDDVVYMDGFKLSLKELGLTRDTLNDFVDGRVLPFMLDDEMRELYRRAHDNPDSLTPAEKNRVLGRIPPEDEERLCFERLGYSKKELYEKAETQVENMSMLECDMVNRGADYDWKNTVNKMTDLQRILGLPADDRTLILKGREGVKGPAILNAAQRRRKYTAVRAAKARQLGVEFNAARLAQRGAWVQDMANRNLSRWGFVVMRTEYGGPESDEAWKDFQVRYNRSCNQIMKGWAGGPPEVQLWLTHESVFVSDPALEGASADALRDKFKSMRGDLPEGVRRDGFLVQDVPFTETKLVTLRAINPDHDPDAPLGTVKIPYDEHGISVSEKDLVGYAGEVKVPMPKVFDWLHYSLLTGTSSWETRYKETTQKDPKMYVPYWPTPDY